MKLFGFHVFPYSPNAVSFYVVAETEKDALEAVNRHNEDNPFIRAVAYSVTVAKAGQVVVRH